MNNTLIEKWFVQPKRYDLVKHLDNEMYEATSKMIDYNLYNQSDVDVVYKVSALGAWITVLHLIRYLAVDPSGRRPWVARKSIKEPLELTKFKEYITDIITWLTHQPPNNNYSALVHTQAVVNFLTTMEFDNGRRRK